MRERLTHAHIIEWFRLYVHNQEFELVRHRNQQEPSLSTPFDTFDRIRREANRNICETALDQSHTHGILRDGLEHRPS